MTDQTSARFAWPLIAPGQAQKELTHNEALTLVDLTVQASVVAVGSDTPAAAPEIGECWVVGTAPTDAWAGQAQALAGWTGGGWRFVAARPGLAVWSLGDQAVARFGDGGWRVGDVAARRIVIDGAQVVGARDAAIADPAGGTTSDDAARVAIGAILAALRRHGLIAT